MHITVHYNYIISICFFQQFFSIILDKTTRFIDNNDAIIYTFNGDKMIEKYLRYKFKISTFDVLESTNTTAKELAQNGADEGTVIIAKEQTAGKGRLSRTFFSPNGGLYMSIILRPTISSEKTTFITAAAAVAVCRAIKTVTGIDTGIKWVNDIYLNGKKVCGILTNGAINSENKNLDYAILGIGLNIDQPKNGFNEEIKNIATCLFKENCDDKTKAKLTAEILNEFFDLYRNIENKTFLKEYRERSVIIGKTVFCADSCGEFPVKVEAIDDDARLIVTTVCGEKLILNSGEVRIKV